MQRNKIKMFIGAACLLVASTAIVQAQIDFDLDDPQRAAAFERMQEHIELSLEAIEPVREQVAPSYSKASNMFGARGLGAQLGLGDEPGMRTTETAHEELLTRMALIYGQFGLFHDAYAVMQQQFLPQLSINVYVNTALGLYEAGAPEMAFGILQGALETARNLPEVRVRQQSTPTGMQTGEDNIRYYPREKALTLIATAYAICADMNAASQILNELPTQMTSSGTKVPVVSWLDIVSAAMTSPIVYTDDDRIRLLMDKVVLDSSRIDVYTALGTALAKAGDLPRAREAFAQADALIAQQSNLSIRMRSYRTLGRAQAEAGDLQGSRKSFDASLALYQQLQREDPSSLPAVEFSTLAFSRAYTGDTAGAQAMLATLEPSDERNRIEESLTRSATVINGYIHTEQWAAALAAIDKAEPSEKRWLVDLIRKQAARNDAAGTLATWQAMQQYLPTLPIERQADGYYQAALALAQVEQHDAMQTLIRLWLDQLQTYLAIEAEREVNVFGNITKDTQAAQAKALWQAAVVIAQFGTPEQLERLIEIAQIPLHQATVHAGIAQGIVEQLDISTYYTPRLD